MRKLMNSIRNFFNTMSLNWLLTTAIVIMLSLAIGTGVLFVAAHSPNTNPTIATRSNGDVKPAKQPIAIKVDINLVQEALNTPAKADLSVDTPQLISNAPIVKYTNEEVTCLARNIYFEARNQSILGQQSVAWVTMNRVHDKKWPNEVCAVVYQRKQFSWTIKYAKNTPQNKFLYDIAIVIAQNILHESRNGGEDVSQGALYYHADYVNPRWNKRVVKISKIDAHIFYK